MLSYQHGYHAGNPADVHKHLTLIAVIQRLQAKESSIHYFDTHAGKGHYDLTDAQAQKTGEFAVGVARMVPLRERLVVNPIWAEFFAALDSANAAQTNRGQVIKTEQLRYYPGSPGWISRLRREQDRHTVFELHPAEHEVLSTLGETHTGRVVYGDGLQGVVKLLPPKTPRLMVLIDPAYENKTEYDDVASAAAKILQRCRHAVVLIWYPLLPAAKHQTLLARISNDIPMPVLQSEFHYQANSGERGMYGAGMLVVNPPWQLEKNITELMSPILAEYGEVAKLEQSWLVAE
ncbi:23S rRNA (adenine(2030)-N(6))-methyltransferase RlmJ [Aliidiomarina iranensis]|uniref:Ribosomal RNA large subunit methyltransferase J n=1 Tax=Aliidiomarina iranensis TaxID=1434071 RepID=A0A432W1Y3_9GAMM|nr:23S rRNA (adenine(2030)-N(6))-methyltransferase RlmJ [Aliidiomarina iranensis]RUO23227.1 23S rRNA (adenine(2030)-N(6))-methyltransferase RlmJ [Aliidiomarina iranensis]